MLLYGLTGAGVYWALHWLATRVVYQGSRSVPEATAADGLGAEDVWLRTEDGVAIHGWWVKSEGSRLATLFLHGNAGNIGHRAGHIREIVAAGSDVLIIDYRGYGRSQGRPTERGLKADAGAAWDYLAARGKPIVIHCRSSKADPADAWKDTLRLLRLHWAEFAPWRAGRRHDGVDGLASLHRPRRRFQAPPQRQI